MIVRTDWQKWTIISPGKETDGVRKLYDDYLYIPKHGKMKEKLMVAQTVITVMVMIGCMAAMSMIGYAYFSAEVTSGVSVIRTADFDLDVSVTRTDSETAGEKTAGEKTTEQKAAGQEATGEKTTEQETTGQKTVEPETVTATYTGYELGSGTYTVLLKKTGTAKTGFCVIEITCGETSKTYYTQQIGVSGTDEKTEISFTLDLSRIGDDDKVSVSFIPHWGTSCYYDGSNNGENKLYVGDQGTVQER